MKLFLEQGRNNTKVDEQGFVNEGRSFHMKRMDCEEFQNLKKAREKKKGRNAKIGVWTIPEGPFILQLKKN